MQNNFIFSFPKLFFNRTFIILLYGYVLQQGGRVGNLDHHQPEDYFINLKKFYQTMNNFIPPSFFERSLTKVDHSTIAFNRYCDALLQNGILERRIANVVMGLEALFLVERQELKYRLTTRICKIFSLLGYDPFKIKEVITDAYSIRSIFAHGGLLSSKRRKMLESKYKTIKNLLLSALNYLRISLIIMITKDREKDEFIALIDDALIDRKKEEELSQAISIAKNICKK